MKTAVTVLLGLTLVCLSAIAADGESAPTATRQWGQWRGPVGSGVAPHGNPPVRWSEGENVRWKTELPGAGHSTPVVWGDRIFVTSAVPIGETVPPPKTDSHGAHHNVTPVRRLKFVVVAIDRREGAIVWQTTVRTAIPHESTHETASWASNSPATDGKSVFASFGSHGVFALDMDGKLLWETDLGEMRIKHGHGEGSSPALWRDTLVVNWDHEEASFVVGLDTRTGKERWRVTRDEMTSWSSPLIVEVDGKPQVIVAATTRVRGYDLATGKVVWECGGLSGNVVASPVAADGVVYVANSYDTKAMLAIRLSGSRGEITGSDAVVWTRHRDTPYVPSPILYDDRLCFLKHYQGFLTCVDAGSGKTLYGPVRLDGIRNVYASPVGAADRFYIVDRNGTTLVIKAAGEFEVMARNSLDESFSASPAIVGDDLFLRGERFLYRLTNQAGAGDE